MMIHRHDGSKIRKKANRSEENANSRSSKPSTNVKNTDSRDVRGKYQYRLAGCDAVYSGKKVRMFRKNLLPHNSR